MKFSFLGKFEAGEKRVYQYFVNVPILLKYEPIVRREKILSMISFATVILGASLIVGCTDESPEQSARRRHEDFSARMGGLVELMVSSDYSNQKIWCTVTNGTDRDAVLIRHESSFRALLHTPNGKVELNSVARGSETSSPDIRNVISLPPKSQFSFFIPIRANYRLKVGDKISIEYYPIVVRGNLKKALDEWPDAEYDSSLVSSMVTVK
jgi:hypothetical protein